MSTKFERFAKMVKEEFGLTVVKTESREMSTFESLFGVSVENITQYELPYNISTDNFGYYDDSSLTKVFNYSLPTKIFDANEFSNLAA